VEVGNQTSNLELPTTRKLRSFELVRSVTLEDWHLWGLSCGLRGKVCVERFDSKEFITILLSTHRLLEGVGLSSLFLISLNQGVACWSIQSFYGVFQAKGAHTIIQSMALFSWWFLRLLLMLMLIYYERKTLLNDWLILTDKLKRTGPIFVWLLFWSRCCSSCRCSYCPI
jgi:hypothetical protein